MSRFQSRRSLAVLVGVLLAAFALRIFRLDVQSLWWDEGISLHLATSSLAEIIANRAANTHPPLYFMALKGWVALVGFTPFAARYSSVLASLLQVTAVYAATCRWFKKSAAVWASVALIAISPLSVIYGQEIRVYAFLPLVYLAALLVTHQLTQPKETSPNPKKYAWIGLAAVEWVGLHLHYVTIFMIAYITIWAVSAFYRQGRWSQIRMWTAVQFGVGLASLPWVAVVLANWTAVQAEASSGSFLAEPITFPFMVAQVWGFHLTGLAGALGRPVVAWLIGLTALCLLALFLLGWQQRRQSLQLATHWLLPLALALGVWSLRSFSHPRYVAVYAVMLIPLAAFLLAGRPRWLRTSWLGLPFILLSLWGLWAYFYDPGVAKDDMRGAARYLETAVSPTDLIIVPDAGWALEFEYNGRAPIVMPNLNDQVEIWNRLSGWTAEPRQIFTLMSAADNRDWQKLLPFALEQAGSLVATHHFDGLVIRQYDVVSPMAQPQMVNVSANFGAIQLVGLAVENNTAVDSAITLALTWQTNGAAAPRMFVGLRLLDVDSWPLISASEMLLDPSGRPTDYWLPGESVTTYHVLPIPPGTPPLTYSLVLGLDKEVEEGGRQKLDLLDAAGSPQGQQMRLTDELTLDRPLGLNNPYRLGQTLPRLPEPAAVAPGLTLLAAGLDRGEVGQGQSLLVSLEWQAGPQRLADIRPFLVLRQGEIDLVVSNDAPAQGRYPTNVWTPGEQVLEHRSLRIPPDTAAGRAVVAVVLDDVFIEIGTVDIVAEARLFDPPLIESPLSVQFGQTARLVGYDLPVERVTAGDLVPLTLYWEALTDGGDVSYTVFAHVLTGDGRLIGQHDAPPVNGARPTTGWVAGEYLIDPHSMSFRESGYAGEALIEVGLYDPGSGVRLTTPEGKDHFILPVTVQVTADE